MRCESAARAKRPLAPPSPMPREGTRIRRLYDLLMANKGIPVDMPLSKFESARPNGQMSIVNNLRDFYGLDIRNIKYGKGVLAGEWFGRTYVDYIADRLARLAREARQ